MRKFLFLGLALLSLVAVAGATQWYEPPGGAASAISDSNRLLIEQNGVSRSITRGLLLKGSGWESGIVNLSGAQTIPGFKNFTTGLKAKDVIASGPVVDIRVFMDGQSGRPTLAQWQANKAGTDITAVWSRAITMLPAGATLRLTPDTYLKHNDTSASVSGKHRITIDGNGATLLAPSPNPDQYFAIWIEDSDTVTVKNFVFDRRNSYESGKSESGVHLSRSTNVAVLNCDFSECAVGVDVKDSPRFKVKDCWGISRLSWTQPNQDNLLLSKMLVNVLDTTGHISANGEVSGNYVYGYNNLIYNEDGDDINVHDNWAVEGYDSQLYSKGSGTHFTNNHVIHPGKDGIKVLANTGGEKAVVTGNTVIKPGWNRVDGGVGIEVAGLNHTVTGNYVELDSVANLAAPTTHGIVLNGHDFTVTGNQIYGPGTTEDVTGIWFYYNSAIAGAADQYNALIASNKVTNCQKAINVQGNGSYDTKDLTIVGNDLSYGQYGINIGGSVGYEAKTYGMNVMLNQIKYFSVKGIAGNNMTGGKFKYNDIVGTGTGSGSGIEFINGTGFTLWLNEISSVNTGVKGDAATTGITTYANTFGAGVTPYTFAASGARTETTQGPSRVVNNMPDADYTFGTNGEGVLILYTSTAQHTITVNTPTRADQDIQLVNVSAYAQTLVLNATGHNIYSISGKTQTVYANTRTTVLPANTSRTFRASAGLDWVEYGSGLPSLPYIYNSGVTGYAPGTNLEEYITVNNAVNTTMYMQTASSATKGRRYIISNISASKTVAVNFGSDTVYSLSAGALTLQTSYAPVMGALSQRRFYCDGLAWIEF